MKKLLMTSLMVSVFLMAHANAGIFLISSAASTSNEWDAGFKRIGGEASIVASTVAGLSIIKFGNLNLGAGLLISGVVLDVDGNLPETELKELLNEKYPFIDNDLVMNNLVNEINDQFQKTKENYTSISHDRVLEIISPLDISNEDVANLINDLK